MAAIQRCRYLIYALGLGAVVAGVLFLAGNLAVEKTGPYVYHQLDAVPECRVGIVLGTSKHVAGRPNLYYVYRIQAAAELYHAGKIAKILASGDHSRKNYNEPEDMRGDLIAAGVDPGDIVLDYAGLRTLDSMVRAREIFQVDRLIVISQDFHCRRALYLGDAHGVEAFGYAARDLSWRFRLKMFCRESLARCAAWIDVNILHRSPRHLGEPLPIEGE